MSRPPILILYTPLMGRYSGPINVSIFYIMIFKNFWNVVLGGAIVGTIISSAIYFSTEFRNLQALFAGTLYGIIIDIVATRLSRRDNKHKV